MDKQFVLNSLKKLDSESKPRNFTQTIEAILTFKNLEVSKPSGQFNLTVAIPYPTGKETAKTLLFAKNKSFAESIKNEFSKIIMEEEIPKLTKKEIQELLNYDVLFAEGPAMISVAKYLGQDLAPKGKMPKPLTDLRIEAVREQLKAFKNTINISNKKGKGIPMVQVVIGKEDMQLENIAENFITIYNAVINALPKKKYNLKAVYLKKTMSPTIKLEEK